MKWFDNPNLYYAGADIAKQLVVAHARIHHLELQLKKKNEKLARLHRKMRMSRLEYFFKSSLKNPKTQK